MIFYLFRDPNISSFLKILNSPKRLGGVTYYSAGSKWICSCSHSVNIVVHEVGKTENYDDINEMLLPIICIYLYNYIYVERCNSGGISCHLTPCFLPPKFSLLLIFCLYLICFLDFLYFLTIYLRDLSFHLKM